MSRGCAKASACRLQVSLSCAVLCQIVSLQYLSRSSLHRFAGLPCRLFLSYGLQVVTREVHRSSLRRLMCPAQDHFIVSFFFIFHLFNTVLYCNRMATQQTTISMNLSITLFQLKCPICFSDKCAYNLLCNVM